MRLRSRAAETEDVNQRRMGRGSVSTTAVQPRAIRYAQQWPGPPRLIQPKDFGSETITELDGRYVAGRFLRVAIPAQTWDGPLTLGDVVEQERWPDVETLPADGYYTVFVSLHPDAGVRQDVAWELRVGGSTVRSGTSWTVEGVPLAGVLPTSPAESGDGWELVNVGDPVDLDGGQLVVHLVEPVATEPPPATVEEPVLIASSYDGSVTATVEIAAPSETSVGDMLIICVGRNGDVETPHADVELLADFPPPLATSAGEDARFQVFWRWADVEDATQARVYTQPGDHAGIRVFALRPDAFLPSEPFGTSVLLGDNSEYQAPSDGRWVLCFAGGNRASFTDGSWWMDVAGEATQLRGAESNRRHDTAIGFVHPGGMVNTDHHGSNITSVWEGSVAVL